MSCEKAVHRGWHGLHVNLEILVIKKIFLRKGLKNILPLRQRLRAGWLFSREEQPRHSDHWSRWSCDQLWRLRALRYLPAANCKSIKKIFVVWKLFDHRRTHHSVLNTEAKLIFSIRPFYFNLNHRRTRDCCQLHRCLVLTVLK